ncbi:hypothetical protein D3C76_1163400 [compost metagenome]
MIAEIGDIAALQVCQRDHHQLLAGGLFMGLQLLNQLLAHRWLDHLGVIHHPPGQLRELQLGLDRQGKQPQQQHQTDLQRSHWQPRTSLQELPKAAIF